MTRPVSRVLSCVAIYLVLLSPWRLKPPFRTLSIEPMYDKIHQPALHRIGFTWHGSLLPSGGLLPRLSTLTAAGSGSGLFLLHFPWGRPRLSLTAILLFDARTFLINLKRLRCHMACSLFYYTIFPLPRQETLRSEPKYFLLIR